MYDNPLICYSCNENLPIDNADPTPRRRKTDSPRVFNSLDVEFSGGYHDYIDGHKYVAICQGCADELRKAFPWVNKALNEAE